MRVAFGEVLRWVVALVLVLGALPLSFVAAAFMTAAMTGWSRPDPEGIIQGCETELTCAEAATFWPAWMITFGLYAACSIFLAVRLSRRAKLDRATESASVSVPA